MNVADDVYNFTAKKIKWLIDGHDGSEQRAICPVLAKNVGSTPGANVLLYDVLYNGMPESMYGRNGCPSWAEWSVFIALTMFAAHQKAKDVEIECMNQKGMSLGKAVAQLVEEPEDKERITARFDKIMVASDIIELSQFLKDIIHMLRRKSIPLDYPALAKDLYFFQTYNGQGKTCLKWGQDYYHELYAREKKRKEAENNEAS